MEKMNVGADPCVRPLTQKGITLIALIITIIVMLILVGVTINVALNGGLFNKAKTAQEQTQKEAIKEQAEVAKTAAYAEAIKNSVAFGVSDAVAAIAQELKGRAKGTYVEVTTKGGTYYVVVDNELKVTVTETEPEVKPISEVDDLIPTSAEKAEAAVSEGIFYVFIADTLAYIELNGAKTVQIYNNDGGYFWCCDVKAASDASQGLEFTFEANKWYFTADGETYTLYGGTSPISASDFNSEDIKSESYLNRVIASFSSTNN